MGITSWFRVFRNARGVWCLLHDDNVHWAKKAGVTIATSLTLVYALWPVDLIPDIIPVFGWLDDIGLIAFCATALNLVGMRYAEHQLPAANQDLPSATGSHPRPP